MAHRTGEYGDRVFEGNRLWRTLAAIPRDRNEMVLVAAKCGKLFENESSAGAIGAL
jgi:hypothetical protein